MSDVVVIARYALRECLRRRVFTVVLVLTVLFGGLYALGAAEAFHGARSFSGRRSPVDAHVVVGSTIFGLAMFSILFLGAVLAVFLTVGAIRGDAERGVLQPLVVRPVGRTQLLAGRYLAAASVCAAYVLVVYATAVAVTSVAGGWTPDDLITPGLALAAGVVVVAGLSLLGSVFLSATANGIAVLMLFGSGLAAGLLGQIGRGLGSDALSNVATVASWAMPFEALYQDGLYALTSSTTGFTSVAVRLGPFGGAHRGGLELWGWALVYLAAVALAARRGFARRDL
jgi:Cu-processing system permease protein